MKELIFRPIALLPFFSALSIIITIIFYVIKAKKSALLFSLLAMQVILFLWPLGQAIQYCATNNRIVIFTIYLIHTAINFLGLAWLLFVIRFTSAGEKIDYGRVFPLLALPLITYFLFLTNNYHHLYFKTVGYDPEIIIHVSYGWVFWFAVLHSYGYITTGIVILVKHAFKQTGITKGQSLVLALAPLASFSVSVFCNVYIFIAKIDVPEFFDPTPTLFSVSMLLFSVAAFRFRFLNINPGALKKTFEDLHDSILVIDNNNCIVNFNKSFTNNFGTFKLNTQCGMFIKLLRAMLVKDEEAKRILRIIEFGSEKPVEIGEITVAGAHCNPHHQTYQVIIQKLDYNSKIYRSRIITFHDITEYRQLLKEVNLKNQDLLRINNKLNHHLQTLEELAIVKERNRVAREIHDKLGHTLTALIMLMKAVKIESKTDASRSSERLSEGIIIAQSQMIELRKSIAELISEETNEIDIVENINNLVRQAKNLGINVEFTVFNQEIYEELQLTVYKYRLSDAVYKICKEAITNSLRHGKASQANIILKFTKNIIQLYIIDNGKGCEDIIKGFGLSGMEDRVLDLKGEIRFNSDGESGFHIKVRLPLENAELT